VALSDGGRSSDALPYAPGVDRADIDLMFVPAAVDSLQTLPAGSELLIVDERTDQVHLLNPTATLAWSFADGRGSLADFAADLASGTGAEPDQVAADLVGLAIDLVGRGLWRDLRVDGLRDEGLRPTARDADRPGPNRIVAGRPEPGLDARFPPGDTELLIVRRRSVELDLRVDDPGLAAELAGDLAGAGLEVEVPSGDGVRPAPPLYSVLLGRPSGPVVGLHLVRRVGRPVRRCRHRDDLRRIVVAEIVAVLDREAEGRPLLDAVGLIREGRMVAVDPLFSSIVDDLEPRLRRLGIGRADASLLALAPCDPGIELATLVLRPAADPSLLDPHLDVEARAARLTVRAIDLARGPDGRLGAGSVEQLHQVLRTTPVVRVPGRDALREELVALLA
jgi:hypothetical protein